MVELENGKKLSASDDGVPFPAVVGQDRLKRSLLVAASNSAVDGVLVRGEKGTAKSTAARGLASLLPQQEVVADCPYGCSPAESVAQCSSCRTRSDPPVGTRPVPFVTLPLGASRDRIVGSLSVEDALDGESSFEPGLLARANRGFLYVDEVNLLDDHLVDVLLDAAASGVNRVERDGVSETHPSEFTLIGTMNPEEGSLRPQFRDRFTMQVSVSGATDLERRTTVVERALDEFDGDYDAETKAISGQITDARDLLSDVTLPDDLTTEIAELCRDAGVDGHRADIATARIARTLAALDGRPRVLETDVRAAAEFALPHRLETTPFDDAPDAEDVIEDHFEDDVSDDSDGESDDGETEESAEDGGDTEAESGEAGSDESDAGGGGTDGGGDETGHGGDDDHEDGTDRDHEDGTDRDSPASDRSGGAGDADTDSGEIDPEQMDASDEGSEEDGTSDGDGDSEGDRESGTDDSADEPDATPLLPGQSRETSPESVSTRSPEFDTPAAERAGSGDHAASTPSTDGHGATVRTERASTDDSVDAAASVRAAAARGSDEVASRDLRQSVRTGGGSALVVFALDASASMRGPMETAKGVALDLLQDAYERRDEVAVVTFAGESADVVLPPTDSVDLAARHLKSLPTGDRTPLPPGIDASAEVIDRADPEAAVVVIVTDGRANAGTSSPTADTRSAASHLADRNAEVLVVDAGTDQRTSLVGDIVAGADGERVPLADLTPDRVAGAVQRAATDGPAGESGGGV